MAWNGLTYDVVTGVGPADLNADIAALTDARVFDSKSDTLRLGRMFAPDTEFINEWQPVQLMAACILSRLGEAQLAERCNSKAHARNSDGGSPNAHLQSDPFIELADYWIRVIHDRAIREHTGRDDRPAADDAGLIIRVLPRIEAQSASRGSGAFSRSRLTQDGAANFDFFGFAKGISSDSKRRLVDPRPALGIVSLRSSHAGVAECIASLISHLDDASFFSDQTPGSLTFDSNPVVEALVKEGDAAVDPLLVAMERDNGLTRVARHDRRTGRSFPVSVSYAAYYCLTRILRISEFGGTGSARVNDIRSYWRQNYLAEHGLTFRSEAFP